MNHCQASCGHFVIAVGAPNSTARKIVETTPCDACLLNDGNIWRQLVQDVDGFIPRVPRRWMFIGTRKGHPCRFMCELEKKVNETCYIATAIFGENLFYLCHDYVNLSELEAIPGA